MTQLSKEALEMIENFRSPDEYTLNIERAKLKATLEKRVKNTELKGIHLPKDPSANWTYPGRPLKPIYLPGQKK